MSTSVTIAGGSYTVPALSDSNWGTYTSTLLTALSNPAKILQTASSTFTLTTDVDTGATYGFKSAYLKSRATNPSATGIIRLGNNESVGFRNAANNADLLLTVNASNLLQFNGSTILLPGLANIVNADVSVTAAIAYSKLNLSTSIVNADIAVAAAIALSKLAAVTASRALVSDGSGVVSVATTTATEIGYVNGVTSALQTQLDAKAPLAGPTFTGTTTVAQLIDSGLTASTVPYANASKQLTSSSVTPTELGYVSGVTSAIQTQIDSKTNKSILTTKGDIFVATGASTPVRQAIGSDGQILVSDSSQTNGLKWATANSGSKNYFTYSSIENNATTGWSLGTATLTSAFPSGAPTFGSGASGNLSLTTVAGSVIAGTYSLSVVSSAATTAGNFVASDAFTVDAEDQAKILAFKFSYKAQVNTANWSGTSSNSFGVAIYDVTNSAWIQPAGVFNLVQSTGIGIASGTFQTTSNSTSYRLVIYNANATTGANTIYLDSFFLGPQPTSSGAAMSDWVAYTPTGSWSANTTYTGQYKRVGDMLHVQAKLLTSGAPTSASLTVNLPTGFTIDTGKLVDTNLARAIPDSSCTIHDQGVQNYFGFVGYSSTTSVSVSYIVTGNGGLSTPVTQAAPFTFGSTDNVVLTFAVPIVGWSSNTVQSADTDTRVVAMSAYGTPTGTISTSDNVVKFASTVSDNTGSYNPTTGLYTVSVSGLYDMNAMLRYQVTAAGAKYANATLYIDGSSAYSMTARPPADAVDVTASVNMLKQLNAGQTIGLYSNTNCTSPTFGASSSLSIKRLSGPATVQATESVNCRYTNTAGTTLTKSSNNTVPFATKDFDSHSAFVTDTFTVPVSGKYQVDVNAALAAGPTWAAADYFEVDIYKNGAMHTGRWFEIFGAVAGGISIGASALVSCVAGDTIKINAYPSKAAAGNVTLFTGAGFNTVNISRVGN